MKPLETQDQMSPMQAAIVLTVIGSGINIIQAPAVVVTAAGNAAWLVAILSAGFFYTGLYITLCLMNSFPGRSLVSFLPELIGKWGTYVFVWGWLLILALHMSLRVQVFGREFIFFLFDRTPLEVAIFVFLVGAAYGGVQNLGTLIRVAQLVFFLVVPLMVLFISFALINTQFINLFPLWPQKLMPVFTSIPACWELFSGYELLLVLFPFITRDIPSLLRYSAYSFLIRMIFILIGIIASIGVLTVAGVKATSYPTLLAVRLAELPGTFLERLDNYLLLSWIPIASLSVSTYMFCMGKTLAELHGFSDHRPFVLLLLPVFFFMSMSFHDLRVSDSVNIVSNALGFILSFGLVPLLLCIAWLRKRRMQNAAKPPS